MINKSALKKFYPSRYNEGMVCCTNVDTASSYFLLPFENADVTASIYSPSEHAHGALEITQRHFDCLFSFVKVRLAECESKKRLRVDGNIFKNAPRVDVDIFLYG